MSLLSDAAAYRAEVREAAYGQEIVYSRGELTATFIARVGLLERLIETNTSSMYTHESDFVFAIALAVWSVGGAFIPQPGDKITLGGKVYEVANLGNTQCYEESDSFGVSWRVHTKEVAS